MKNILFLFCLISISMQAKYYKATLTFQNGEVKQGFAEMVEITDSKIKFRLTEKGDTEKLLSTDLKKIEYRDEGDNLITAEQLFINTDKGEKGIKQGAKKFWVYVIYSNGIKLGVDIFRSTLQYNPSTGTSTGSGGGSSLYIGKEKEDSMFFVFFLSDMNSANIGMDKFVRKHCALLFKDCPKFLAAVDAEDFKKKTLVNRLIELYEGNGCNKPVKVEVNKKSSTKKKKK